MDLKKPDESTKLVSSVYSLVSTQNLDHILYYKQNDDDESILYSVDTAGNTEKLVDDYETVTYGDDALYYLGASGETYSLASVLSDADNYTKEPSEDDYSVPYYWHYYFGQYDNESDYDQIVASCSTSVRFFGEYASIDDMQYSSDSAVALACKSFVDKYSSQEDGDGYFPLTDAVKADLVTIAQAYGEYGDTAWHELCVGCEQAGSTTDYDAYYAAQSRYELVQSMKEETPVYNLYSFNYKDGTTTVIAENLLAAVNYQNTIFYYGADALTGTMTVDDVVNSDGSDYLEDIMEPANVHVYNMDTGKTVNMSKTFLEAIAELDDAAMVGDYVLVEDSDEDTLYAAKVSGNVIGSLEIVSDDASICSVEDGVLYYVANKYDSNGTSYVDLYTYANGKSTRAAQDIAADYATVYEDGQLLVHTGYNSYDDKEIALIAKDGTRTVIADGVSWVRRVDKNTTLYISDNDLYSYDGKEKTRLLTDVDQMWCRDTLAGTTIDLGWYGY